MRPISYNFTIKIQLQVMREMKAEKTQNSLYSYINRVKSQLALYFIIPRDFSQVRQIILFCRKIIFHEASHNANRIKIYDLLSEVAILISFLWWHVQKGLPYASTFLDNSQPFSGTWCNGSCRKWRQYFSPLKLKAESLSILEHSAYRSVTLSRKSTILIC